MPRIFVMDGLRELTEGYPVELWRDEKSGRLVVRAKNEGGCNITEIDLFDLINWLRAGPPEVRSLHGHDTA